MTKHRTSFEFLDISRVELVDIRTFRAWHEGLPAGKALSPAVVTAPDRRYWLFDVDDEVPELESLEQTEPAKTVARSDKPPGAPSVAVERRQIRGVWLTPKVHEALADRPHSDEVSRSRDELVEIVELEPEPEAYDVDYVQPEEAPTHATRRADDLEFDDLPDVAAPSPRRHSEILISDFERDETRRAFDSGEPATAAEGAPGEASHVIRRTPHLDAPNSIPTQPGSTFTVAVHLDTKELRPEETGDELALEVASDVRSVTIGVLLNASSHFDVSDMAYQPLLIERDREEAGPVEFSLVVSPGEHRDEAGITALLVYRGHTCGSVTRRWRWSDSDPCAMAVALEDEPTQAALALDVEPPDLSVYVTRPVRDGIHYCCSVQTALLDEYVDPSPPEEWAVPSGAGKWVKRWIDRIVREGSPDDRRSALREAGSLFYEAAPESFKRVLWKLIDADDAQLSSIYIASVEPSLPWEMMVPSRLDADGLVVDREPLGVEFSIGRWIRGDQPSPRPQQIAVQRSFLVAPRYQRAKALDSTAELEFLAAELGGERVDPASAKDLEARFAEANVQLVHFVCHGLSTEDGDLLILDDDKPLRDTTVRMSPKYQALCRMQRPLVFINACEAGALAPTIGGLGGFPKALGEIGARAVIAPLWSVVSTTAGAVAVEIYREALAKPPRPLGEILRDIRSRAYHDADFDDSFAAYCLFGDPLATLERSPSTSPGQGRPVH